jgi:hypothetical protein
MAACLLNGDKKVWVQPISMLTPQERRDIVRDENLHRRVVDRDALIKQRVDESEAAIQEALVAAVHDNETLGGRKPGRPKSARGEAREQVARELGTTPDAVRVAEARATTAELPNKSSETLPPPVETYGLPLVTAAEADELRAIQAAIDQADQALRRAQAALRSVETVPLFKGAQQLLAQVHQAAAEVRRARPAACCPYCKRLPALMAVCTGCRGTGFIDGDAMMGVAAELRLGGDMAMVVTLGKPMVMYAHAKKVTEAKNEKPKAAAKRIAIVDENNKPIPVPAGPEITEEELPF